GGGYGAAAGRGGRPGLVCTATPVALITGVKVAAVRGSDAAAASATLPGLISPERASSWAPITACLTRAGPSRPAAATRRGSASTSSVLGTWRRGSTTATLRRPPGTPRPPGSAPPPPAPPPPHPAPPPAPSLAPATRPT